MENKLPTKKSGCLRWVLVGLGIFLAAVFSFYFAWYKPNALQPISEPVELPTRIPVSEMSTTEMPDKPENLSEVPVFTPPTVAPEARPVCGEETEWLFLLVGIDYRGEGYLYGLADVIRVAQINFVDMAINMVALPRDLIVEVPQSRLDVPSPIKINQAYLFGTPGMGHYSGSGLGAGALAEIIQHNFGIAVNHYAVVNFETFVKFVDEIGGIEVDLPIALKDEKYGSFPAGKQKLNGERTLSLIRIRKNYGDDFRVNNQTLVLRSILNTILTPAGIIKVPSLLDEFSGTILTDLSIDQLRSIGFCFLTNFKVGNLKTYQAPEELLEEDSAFIPTLNDYAFVYRWDEKFLEWVYQSLNEN